MLLTVNERPLVAESSRPLTLVNGNFALESGRRGATFRG